MRAENFQTRAKVVGSVLKTVKFQFLREPLRESKAENLPITLTSTYIKREKARKGITSTIDLLHYNCRNLVCEERLSELENALEDIRWGIVGLSEIRRKGAMLMQRKKGNYFHFYGESVGQKEIGFYIKKKLWDKGREVEGIFDRIGLVKLEIEEEVLLTIVQIYAPTLSAIAKEKEEFWQELQELRKGVLHGGNGRLEWESGRERKKWRCPRAIRNRRKKRHRGEDRRVGKG